MVGIDEGLKRESAVNLDHVQTVDKTRLRRFLGSVSRERMTEVCRALARATGCALRGWVPAESRPESHPGGCLRQKTFSVR